MSRAEWQNIAGSKKFFTLMDILNIFGPLKWLRDIWMVPYSMSSSINMKSNKRETGNREINWCRNKAEYVSISSIGNWWWPDVPTKAYDPWIVTYATEVPLPANPDPCNNLSQPHWHHFLEFVKLIDYNICLQQFDKFWGNMKAHNNRKRKLCEFDEKLFRYVYILNSYPLCPR